MKRFQLFACIVLMGFLAACSSPEERAAAAKARSFSAQEKAIKERLNLVEQYQKCVKAAAGDNQKVEACDSYLKAAQALR